MRADHAPTKRNLLRKNDMKKRSAFAERFLVYSAKAFSNAFAN